MYWYKVTLTYVRTLTPYVCVTRTMCMTAKKDAFVRRLCDGPSPPK